MLGGNVLAEEFKIFSVNPGGDIAMSNDDRAFLGEDAISRNVIEMIVSVDHELDRELGHHADFAEESFRCGLVFKGVDDGDSVIADNEASVGAGFAFGVVNGSVNAVAERFEREGKGGVGLGSRRHLREYGGTAASKNER